MCFTYDAEPPELPVAAAGAGSGVRGEEMVLTSVDGTPFAAFAGHVDALTPPKSAVVILPDVRGLFSFYRELALRFAQAGIEAVAIDYFGRTAGLTPRDETFDYMPHVMQTTPQTVSNDVASAVAYLRNQISSNPKAIFTVGFCFGGRNSFLQAANHLGLAGVVGFYGSLGPGRFPGPTPADLASQFECPVLGLFGGADQGIPQEQIDTFNQALTAAHVAHEIVVFPGAPHSFFDRKQDEFAKESTQSWQLMLDFIAKYTPKA
ncbi:MAG TPA: dienelactone hydrolase family protein [Ktedonobacterales bacterium]